jgi:hypothetical protein
VLREMEKMMQLGLALKEDHLVGAQNQAIPSHTHTRALPASPTKTLTCQRRRAPDVRWRRGCNSVWRSKKITW